MRRYSLYTYQGTQQNAKNFVLNVSPDRCTNIANYLFQNYFSGVYPRHPLVGHPGPGFRGPSFSKGTVEIPVHHETGATSGRQEQWYPQHQHQQEQQNVLEPPVSSPQHAAPPFHLHSQKEAFLPQQAAEQGHPWPMHHNHPPHPQQQQQQQSQQAGSGGAREIPIQHVSTYHIPASARQQLPPQQAGFQVPPHPAQAAGPQGTSTVYTIPVKHEKGNARTQSPSRVPSPKKQYSAPPQPAAGARQQSSPRGTPPPQEARAEPPKQKTAEERAFEIIDGVMNEVKALEESVNNFKGLKGDKDYKYLEEMLTRSLLKLDSVEAEGHDNIRQARKNSVRMIEAALDVLELKAHANEQQSPAETSVPMDTSNHATESEAKTESSPMDSDTQSAERSDGQSAERSGGQSIEKSGGQSNETSSLSNSQAKGKSPGHVKEMVLDSEVSC